MSKIEELTAELVKAMADGELSDRLVQSEAERETIQVQIEAYLSGRYRPSKDGWHNRARIAMKHLRMNASVIKQEQNRRKQLAIADERAADRAVLKQAKALRHERHLAQQREHQEARQHHQQARLQRIQAANAKDIQDVIVFKQVAREVLGDEMYTYLWQETHRRLEQGT